MSHAAPPSNIPPEHHVLTQQRHELLQHLIDGSHKPMIALSFVWVALMIVQVTSGLDRLLQIGGYIIWALFGLQFAAEFVVAPHKITYLRHNFLTAISLFLPAVRLLHLVQFIRILQIGAVTSSFTLVGILGSVNRGMRATRTMIGRRGIGYVTALTALVIFVGAAGMLQFEGVHALDAAGYHQAVQQGQGIHGYADAVWYCAMVLTTIGSSYWAITPPGRIVTYLLALYGIGTLGYITATLASYFVGNDASTQASGAAASASSAAASASNAAAAASNNAAAGPAHHGPAGAPGDVGASRAGQSGDLAALAQQVASLTEQIAALSALIQASARTTGSQATSDAQGRPGSAV
ncbi:MAG: potassium channel family protein [Chloroflexi bacterium]|nr:potassium channel family protein [Chloroflexota bacterium]